jgi:hypothetical protein
MSFRTVGILGIPFAALSAYLLLEIADTTAEALGSTLVAVSVALTIFAVNFSFVAFQLAPYRELRGGPSQKHLLAAVFLVGFGLAPLLGTVSSTKTTGVFAAGVTPLLAYGALLLVAIGLTEAEPDRVLAAKASDKALKQFAPRFQSAAAAQISAFERLDFEANLASEERLPPPSHEIFHRVPPPPLKDDPLEMCVRTAKAAARADDATVFVPAVERLLALADGLREFGYDDVEGVESWKIKGAAASHGEAAISRVAGLLESDGASDVLSDRFIEIIARFTREASFEGRATSEGVEAVFAVGVATAQRQIMRKAQGAAVIGLLLAARTVSDQTLRSLQSNEDYFKSHSLATYPAEVQLIGQAAIEARDSDLLFRCLECLSWIGCAGVKFAGAETGRRAARGLVQLGRLARHAELECHWPNCTLTPYQHAIERLGWIATWVATTDKTGPWLQSLGVAYARLEGFERELRLEPRGDGKTNVQLIKDDERAHKESFFAEGAERTLDYSNESMLKDQVLR